MARTGKQSERDLSSVAGLRGFLKLLAPQWKLALAILACNFALSYANVYLPKTIKILNDKVFPGKDSKMLMQVVGIVVGIYVARNVLFFFSRLATTVMSERTTVALRGRVVEHITRLNLAYIAERSPAKLLARAMDDVAKVQDFIQSEIPEALINICTVIGTLYCIFKMNSHLAGMAVAMLPVYFIVQRFFKARIAKGSYGASECGSTVSARVVEVLLGASVVKATGSEERENAAFRSQMQNAYKANVRLQFWHTLNKVAVDLCIGLCVGATILYGSRQVFANSMSTGDFMAFYGYVMMLFPLAANLTVKAGKIAGVFSSLNRVDEVLRQKQDFIDAPDAADWINPEGAISIEAATFGYGKNPLILRGATMSIAAGERAVIEGGSGSGKSTLAALIGRMMDPTEGAVKLDGKDVRTMKMAGLRRHVAYVQQEPFLFGGTIRENIRYANPHASDGQVELAAQAVLADEFIKELPSGLDTRIGEGGVVLSLGQRVQISLARAVLQDPKILILDDPFSSLDEATAQAIEPRLNKLMEGRTTIIATGKPSSLTVGADRHFKVFKGQVYEVGAKRQLAAS